MPPKSFKPKLESKFDEFFKFISKFGDFFRMGNGNILLDYSCLFFFFHFLANFRTSKKTTAHNVAIFFPKKVFHMSCTGFSFACQDAKIHPKFFL